MRGERAGSISALLTTVHDPAGRMLPALARSAAGLRHYSAVVAAVSSTTSPRLIDELRLLDVQLTVLPPGKVGMAMRTVVQQASSSDRHSFLYCDFDRWLHWHRTNPDEMDSIPHVVADRHPDAWFVCVGRTARAFATHPEVQRVAESATNRALTLAVGQDLDATAGACWFTKQAAEVILAGSIEATKATDLEWPALIHARDASRLAGIRVEGLEFETADFYADEIAAAGSYEAWIAATYDRPEIWRDRLTLAADSAAALARVLEKR